MDIKWEEPPAEVLATAGRQTKYREFAGELRRHPQRWALLPGERASNDSAKNTALGIKNGRLGGMPKGQYEAVADGTKVYVRFIGGASLTPADAPDGGEEPAIGTGEEPRRDAPAIREWARRNGYQVPDRGRLQRAVLEAYDQAQREMRATTSTDNVDDAAEG